jgi:hypothetical protein
MERYKNLNGNSGVTAYKTCNDSIEVKFNNNTVYRYTYTSAGKRIIEKMKKLAKSGRGLSSYISRIVQKKFEKQLR